MSIPRITKEVLRFYLVIGIPISYGVGLWLINRYQGQFGLPFRVQIIGLILALFGLGLWIASYISLGSSFGVLPESKPAVTRGVYRYLRHPMYLGIIATFFGLACALESGIGLLFTIGYLIPLLVVRAEAETDKLIRTD